MGAAILISCVLGSCTISTTRTCTEISATVHESSVEECQHILHCACCKCKQRHLTPVTVRRPNFCQLVMDISTNEETKLRRQLHKSFKAVKNCLSIWKEALAACRQPLDQVENLCEQHQCCSAANIEQSGILKPFPDIKMRLLYKIDVELEEQLSTINVEMKKLENCCERISKHCDYTMKSYQENDPYIPLDKVLKQTPICPAISDMLEWLQQIERLVFQQYHCKKYLLEIFSPKNTDSTENLKNAWSLRDEELISTVEEYLSYTSFFLEEKIT